MSGAPPAPARAIALVSALLTAAALLAACSGGGNGSSSADTSGGVTMPSSIGPPPSATASPSGTGSRLPTDTVAVTTLSTRLGDVLVDGTTGRTFYVFRGDGHDAPTCIGACARVWQPVTGTQIGIAAGLAYQPGEFKLVARPGGGPRQLSVNGHPVYRYTGDTLAGQVNGQGMQDKWFVLGPDGQLVTTTR